MSESATLTNESWETLARRAAGEGDSLLEPELRVELLTCDLAGAPYALPVDRVGLDPRLDRERVADLLAAQGLETARGELPEDLNERFALWMTRGSIRRRTTVASCTACRCAAALS